MCNIWWRSKKKKSNWVWIFFFWWLCSLNSWLFSFSVCRTRCPQSQGAQSFLRSVLNVSVNEHWLFFWELVMKFGALFVTPSRGSAHWIVLCCSERRPYALWLKLTKSHPAFRKKAWAAVAMVTRVCGAWHGSGCQLLTKHGSILLFFKCWALVCCVSLSLCISLSLSHSLSLSLSCLLFVSLSRAFSLPVCLSHYLNHCIREAERAQCSAL